MDATTNTKPTKHQIEILSAADAEGWIAFGGPNRGLPKLLALGLVVLAQRNGVGSLRYRITEAGRAVLAK